MWKVGEWKQIERPAFDGGRNPNGLRRELTEEKLTESSHDAIITPYLQEGQAFRGRHFTGVASASGAFF